MSNINKISVKVEVNPEDHDTDLDMIADTLDEALNLIGCGFEEVTGRFITMRFDPTPDGGIAATVAAAEKRD